MPNDPLVCPKCKRKAIRAFNFCAFCGTSLRKQKAPPSWQGEILEVTSDSGISILMAELNEYFLENKKIPIPTIAQLKNAFTILTEKEIQILIRRYGLDGKPPRTYQVIADEYGASASGARQVTMSAQRKLRFPSRRELFTAKV